MDICNAKNAYEAIQKNISLALMLPCKINVYEKNGIVSLSALRPVVIKGVFPTIDINDLITEVDKQMIKIVEEAKQSLQTQFFSSSVSRSL